MATSYRIMFESTESKRLVSDTSGSYWERVWSTHTWGEESTLKEAMSVTAKLRGGQSKYTRRIWVEQA